MRSTKKCERPVSRIGLVANWNPNKAIEDFVRAAALVREHLGGELEVIFAGAKLTSHAAYCQYVEDLIEDLGLTPCIRDYGFVPSVVDVLAELDVLVLSSLTEAFGMAILEGMAMGVPVVATDVGGVRELVAADLAQPAGILVPPKDPEAMAAAILELLRHADQAARMGQNGRRLAEAHFSLGACVQRHLEVYRRAVGTQSHPKYKIPHRSQREGDSEIVDGK
jgi:glycosyltransferase involved in cell wall biosynthesis